MTKFEVVCINKKCPLFLWQSIYLILNLQALICMSYTYPPPQSANVQMTTALILHIKQGQRFTQWRQCILNQSLQAKSFWLFQTLHFFLLLAQYHFNLSWNPLITSGTQSMITATPPVKNDYTVWRLTQMSIITHFSLTVLLTTLYMSRSHDNVRAVVCL